MSAIKNISLYIPHVFPNFDKEYVANAFNHIGEISQIDFVAKQDRNGNNFNAVYVHFIKWFTNKKALAFYDSVVDESKEARLCHDEPWYWIVLPNTAKKHIPGQRKPTLDLSDMKATSSEQKVVGNSVLTTEKTFEDELAILEGDIQNSWSEFRKKREKMESIVLPKSEEKVEANFDEVAAFEAEIEAEMDEIEEFLEAEDENLIKIDGRYVQQIEAENWSMSAEIAQLRAAIINLDQMYQAEAAKVRAFSVDL
jgi:predicted nucleotide-binding protein (sugar kinase/HSP70/actin superfamily)